MTMTDLARLLALDLAAVEAAMLVLWGIASARRDVSLVDPFWGAGLAGVGWLAAGLSGQHATRVWLLLGLTTVWGLRLSLHLLYRNWGQGEDRRYAAMRSHRGAKFVWVSLPSVFLLQGAILWFVAMPLQVAAANHAPAALGLLDLAGGLLWAGGWICETVGDWQLVRFKADPANAGRVLDRGLWRYTRHPNYFGDACVWWGLYLIAAAGGAGWTIASPAVMTILLLKISGVALLENTIGQRRPEYAAYRTRTNAFFPGPPRSGH